MNKLQKDGPEKIVFDGLIHEVVQQKMKIGQNKKTFERVRRAPGVRLIIERENEILLTKEYRYEQGGYDYRLPGGKVFDSLEEYRKNNDSNIVESAKKAGIRECAEEVGLSPKDIYHFMTSKNGATMGWDLYYFIVDDFEKTNNSKDPTEVEIVKCEWKSVEEIMALIGDSQMKEDRSVGVLFRYLLKNSLIQLSQSSK